MSTRRNIAAWCALAALFMAMTLPAILTSRGGSTMAYDLTDFHWMEIRRLAAAFPSLAPAESFSATAPGFHWILAGILRVSGCSPLTLRVIGSVLGVVALLAAWQVTQRWVRPLRGAALVSPVLCCNYLLGSSIWMTTDAPGFALGAVAVALAFAGSHSRAAAQPLLGGVVSAMAVCVRQTSLWCAAPGCVDALRQWRRGEWRATGAALRIALWVVPPVLALALFVLAWGGLVPPRFQQFHAAGVNWVAPVVTLALLGLWGCALLPGALRSFGPARRASVLIAGVLAAAFALCAATTQHVVRRPESQVVGTPSEGLQPEFAVNAESVASSGVGRWGGPIWSIAARTPLTADISWGVVACAGLGGAVVVALTWRAAAAGNARAAWIIGSMLAAMTLAQMANAQNFERYFDPWVLLGLCWLVAAGSREGSPGDRWCMGGIALLTAAQLAMSVAQVYAPAFTGAPLNLP
jgi:hypothetical protein